MTLGKIDRYDPATAGRVGDRAVVLGASMAGLAVGADFEFPGTTGPKPRGTDLLNRYVNRLIRSAHSDGELTDAFYRVFRLEQRATTLLRPDIAWRVLRP